jgi:hypothetical protein
MSVEGLTGLAAVAAGAVIGSRFGKWGAAAGAVVGLLATALIFEHVVGPALGVAAPAANQTAA